MTYYDINHCDGLNVATVYAYSDDRVGEREVMLHDLVVAALDADGDLLCIDIQDTTMFGTPFDQAAAQRAIDWAREILAGNATA